MRLNFAMAGIFGFWKTSMDRRAMHRVPSPLVALLHFPLQKSLLKLEGDFPLTGTG